MERPRRHEPAVAGDQGLMKKQSGSVASYEPNSPRLQSKRAKTSAGKKRRFSRLLPQAPRFPRGAFTVKLSVDGPPLRNAPSAKVEGVQAEAREGSGCLFLERPD